MSTQFEQPKATYDELYAVKVELCEVLGIDTSDSEHGVESILVESRGFTVTTQGGDKYLLPTTNYKVEDWVEL
jgi:hypothetical protein